MITLYGVGEGFGLPEISPYVMKTEVQLKMAGLTYVKRPGEREQAPKGQVPFIDVGGDRIGDSTFIRAYLERAYGFDLDEGLNEVERAHSWAIERLLENHLSWFGVHDRWLLPHNFNMGPAQFFEQAPAELRDQIREQVVSQLASSLLTIGVSRHSEPEMIALCGRSLQTLAVLLGDKPYLFGDRPTGVDATAFGMLAFLSTPFFDSPVGRKARTYPSLVAYVSRMMSEFYPDFAWEDGAGGARRAA